MSLSASSDDAFNNPSVIHIYIKRCTRKLDVYLKSLKLLGVLHHNNHIMHNHIHAAIRYISTHGIHLYDVDQPIFTNLFPILLLYTSTITLL